MTAMGFNNQGFKDAAAAAEKAKAAVAPVDGFGQRIDAQEVAKLDEVAQHIINMCEIGTHDSEISSLRMAIHHGSVPEMKIALEGLMCVAGVTAFGVPGASASIASAAHKNISDACTAINQVSLESELERRLRLEKEEADREAIKHQNEITNANVEQNDGVLSVAMKRVARVFGLGIA